MQTMDDGPEKQKVIDQMVAIAREDAPWAWGYWPYVALAFQPWAHNGKPTIVVRDLAKYYRVDPALRDEQPHGFVFEVPVGGVSDRTPIRSAGRFAHGVHLVSLANAAPHSVKTTTRWKSVTPNE